MPSDVCFFSASQQALHYAVTHPLLRSALRGFAFCTASQLSTTFCLAATPQQAEESIGTCIVRAAESITLSAEVSGVVASVHVRLDDSVVAGDQLLTLDGRDATLARQQAEVELRRAEVAVERAKALAVQAKSSVKYRKEDLQRNEQLGTNVLESELRRLRESVERAEVEHVVTYNEYLQAQQLVEAAQLRIQMADLTLSRQLITSPTAGQVSQLVASAGERVEAGEPVFELRSMERMLCEIEIDERSPELDGLIGRRVIGSVEVGGEPRAVTGRVISIGNEVSSHGKLTARVELDNLRHQNRWLLSHGSQVSLKLVSESE